ncbi:unnamed protein product [Fraxinus pennsylvanica]|uniref:Uncharacterized protein n=1 Tax=Fraxinus pennsylvanica TaxID=56036 RepID=A0AAD2DUI8_9LAMI|nr:unnamed protein product [Fraxinus pennsylvanica]
MHIGTNPELLILLYLAMDAEEISSKSEEDKSTRKGPWSGDEDFKLKNYIAVHGGGGWEALALKSGLRRTGKSCRLRWLNYLNPDVRRGNITPEEQLSIIELHLQYGNRWSEIAKRLRGRTDNEVKNYWRVTIKKQAKELDCDVNSVQFRDIMHCIWLRGIMEEQIHPTSQVNSESQSRSIVTAVSTDFDHINTQKLMTDSEHQPGFGLVEMNSKANMWAFSSEPIVNVFPVSSPFSYCFEEIDDIQASIHGGDYWLGSEDSLTISSNDEDLWVSTPMGFNQF